MSHVYDSPTNAQLMTGRCAHGLPLINCAECNRQTTPVVRVDTRIDDLERRVELLERAVRSLSYNSGIED